MLEPLSNLTDGQLHHLIYSTWDFQQALSALTFLMEECDFEARIVWSFANSAATRLVSSSRLQDHLNPRGGRPSLA